MNAGAYDGEMAQVVHTAEVLHVDGTLETVDVSEMALSYRHSAFMETGDIITRVTFRLQYGEETAIRARMQELMDRRRDKQPLEYPSAGSFFKRPTGYFAGALIEQSGLKGFTVGGAAVSEKHAGFVINKGGATAADIVALSEKVIEKVKQDTGVTMQPEVRFVGEF
jgi:UDP-N-acetylmuramate dehydrogenase